MVLPVPRQASGALSARGRIAIRLSDDDEAFEIDAGGRLTRQGTGADDPWADMHRGEDHEIHDPVQTRFDAYRGMLWLHVLPGSAHRVVVNDTV